MIHIFKTYAVFLCVTEKEMNSLMSQFDWKAFFVDGDDEPYYRSTVNRGEDMLPIIACQIKEKGSIAAAAVTMNLIHRFAPQYIFMVGYAAGIKLKHKTRQTQHGDVVMADSCWNLSKGKIVSVLKSDLHDDDDTGYIPRPSFLTLDLYVRELLIKLIKNENNPVMTHVGTYLSSGSVVANSHYLEKTLLSTGMVAKALDMESYGVYYACHASGDKKPVPVIIKGISDFANDEKSDEFQVTASQNSCRLAKFLLLQLPYSVVPSNRNGIGSRLRYSSSFQKFLGWFSFKNDNDKAQRRFINDIKFLNRLDNQIYFNQSFDDESISIFSYVNNCTGRAHNAHFYKKNNDGKVVFALINPDGSNIPSMFFRYTAYNCFFSFFNSCESMNQDIRRMNEIVSYSNISHIMCEMWIGLYDPNSGLLSYASAGHNSPFLLKGDQEIEEVEDFGNANMGQMLGKPEAEFASGSITVSRYDKLFIFSKETLECMNPEGEEFGRRRMSDFIEKNNVKDNYRFCIQLDKSLHEHQVNDIETFDWATMIVNFK